MAINFARREILTLSVMNTARFNVKSTFYLIALFFVLSSFGFQPSFDINITHASGPQSSDGKIEITIYGGSSSYDCYLYVGAPWKGGSLIEKKQDVSFECDFKNLKPGKYMVIVEDKEKVPIVKEVEIEAKHN
jgi:hypothetical protein